MKSRPNFEVDIVKPNGKTLSFTCSYILDNEEGGSSEEGFGEETFYHECYLGLLSSFKFFILKMTCSPSMRSLCSKEKIGQIRSMPWLEISLTVT